MGTESTVLAGPLLARELTTAPRRRRFYVVRAIYPLALLLVIATIWLVTSSGRDLITPGDVARFAEAVLRILAPLQLTVMTAYAALAAAAAVAAEKDRRTLSLLLMTRLTDGELVVGKLLASLMLVVTTLACGMPVFAGLTLLGGVSWGQVLRIEAVSLAAIAVAAALGTTIAFWRERTYQTLALVALVIVGWIGGWEAVAATWPNDLWGSVPVPLAAAAFSPWRAMEAALVAVPTAELRYGVFDHVVWAHAAFATLVLMLIVALAVLRVRAWNTTREPRRAGPHDAESLPSTSFIAATRPTRSVSQQPILWREVSTWAYGRKTILVRLLYLALVGFAAWSIWQSRVAGTSAAWVLAPVGVLSLMLLNAQCVTAITSERDGGAFDLLLLTDLSARELVFGKLGGSLFNAKEMLAAPVLLGALLPIAGLTSWENAGYLIAGFLVLAAFAALVGLHSGLLYARGMTAVAVSLGTLFFLLVGVSLCLAILVAFSNPYASAFTSQLAPFLAFMFGGGVGLFFALSGRRPSAAIGFAAAILPLATFFAVTNYLIDYTLGVFLFVAPTYLFATLALLIPDLAEFDSAIARGREE